MADRIRDRVGINVHTAQASYSNRALIAQCLDYLGVTRVRDNNPNGAAVAGLTKYKYMTVCLSTADVTKGKTAGTEEFEATNEGDLNYGTSGTNLTNWKNMVRDIGAAVGRSKRVIGPSCTGGPISPAYTSGFGEFQNVDTQNVHCYRANRSASAWAAQIAGNFNAAKSMAPWRPVMVTEMGAHDYSGPDNHGHVYTPADVYGTQIVGQVLDFFAAGAERIYVYELIDNPNRVNDSEGHFGLFTAAGTAKPAAVALKTFLDRYGDYDITSIPAIADTVRANQVTINNLNATVADLQQQLANGGGGGGGPVAGERQVVNFKAAANLAPLLLPIVQPGTSETTLYTVPSGHGMKISSASVYNPTGGAITFEVSVARYQTAASAGRVKKVSVAAGSTVQLTELIGTMLSPGDYLSGLGSATGLLVSASAADAF